MEEVTPRSRNAYLEIGKADINAPRNALVEKSQLYSACTPPLHFRPHGYSIFRPCCSGIDSCHFLSLCFANNDAPVKHSRGAPARTAPNPPGSTCPRPFNLVGRMPMYWRRGLYRCCGAIRKDDLALIAPFNVERQLNLARCRRQRDTSVYYAFRVIRSHERNGSALLHRQCGESINTYGLMMR